MERLCDNQLLLVVPHREVQGQPAIQVRRRLQAALERFPRVIRVVVEDRAVVEPADLGASFLGLARRNPGWQWLTALEALREVLPIAPDVELEPFGQSI